MSDGAPTPDPSRGPRRAAELELWCDEHLAALASLQACDLADPAVVRAIATRAKDLADCAELLEAVRGDDEAVELAVRALRRELARL